MLFLCYRRGDHERSALRIRELLADVFGAQEIVDPILVVGGRQRLSPGARDPRPAQRRVRRRHRARLAGCGRHRGRQRDDFMCLAIESALKEGKRVVPVLVDGAQMPRAEQLPAALQGIVHRQFSRGAAGRRVARGLARLRPRRRYDRPSIPPRHRCRPPPRRPDRGETATPAQHLSPPAPSYRSSAPAGSARVPPASSAPPRPQRSGMLSSILTGLRTLWSPKPDASPGPVAAKSADRVLLAASAPRSSLGRRHVHRRRSSAYVEQARASALKKTGRPRRSGRPTRRRRRRRRMADRRAGHRAAGRRRRHRRARRAFDSSGAAARRRRTRAGHGTSSAFASYSSRTPSG